MGAEFSPQNRKTRPDKNPDNGEVCGCGVIHFWLRLNK
jgi:hypothetical protein